MEKVKKTNYLYQLRARQGSSPLTGNSESSWSYNKPAQFGKISIALDSRKTKPALNRTQYKLKSNFFSFFSAATWPYFSPMLLMTTLHTHEVVRVSGCVLSDWTSQHPFFVSPNAFPRRGGGSVVPYIFSFRIDRVHAQYQYKAPPLRKATEYIGQNNSRYVLLNFRLVYLIV